MKRAYLVPALGGLLSLSIISCGGDSASSGAQTPGGGTAAANSLSFFVTSATSMTGNLGGLAGADKRCQDLAGAIGVGNKKWAAYLSTEKGGPGDGPVHAKDRIGKGPWFNAKMMMVARDLADLHARPGDAEIFVDEKGNKINGQWSMSPRPNEHDILTGTNPDGTVAVGKTCADWTSTALEVKAQVGHSDGLGPMMATTGTYPSWNSSHESAGCNDTAPRGGAGRFYCFAVN
jgi:hypothetical protein